MAAQQFQSEDYLRALQSLLPRGRVWPRDTDSVVTKVLKGLVQSNVVSNASAAGLLVQAFPATAGDLLTEWESTLGLPGIYGVLPGTISARQAAVVAALTASGGQSKGYFIALAALLGYTITITEFVASSVNSPVNAGMTGPPWAHAWQVNGAASAAVFYSPAPDVIQATPGFGIPTLDAVLAKYKPAQTVVITSYT